MITKRITTKKIITLAMLIALSAVLALVRIPIPPITTLAFDSLPGFVAAALFGPLVVGIVGALGHLFTALYSGFPFGAVAHLIVMATMFITMFVFGLIYRKGFKIPAAITALIVNGPISLIPFIFLFGWGMVVSMILPLSIAAAVNIVIAMIIIPILEKALKLDTRNKTLFDEKESVLEEKPIVSEE